MFSKSAKGAFVSNIKPTVFLITLVLTTNLHVAGATTFTNPSRRAKTLTVDETYIGCVNPNESIADNSLIFYVDLIEVGEYLNGTSDAKNCYELCLKKSPLSSYVTLQHSVLLCSTCSSNNCSSNRTADACGCLMTDQISLDNLLAEPGCTEDSVAQVFCGPDNRSCYNVCTIARPSASGLMLGCIAVLLARFTSGTR